MSESANVKWSSVNLLSAQILGQFILRFTHYTPDLFFIIFYTTLFFFSGILDICFAFYIFLLARDVTLGGIFLGTIILPGILEFTLDRSLEESLPNLRINKILMFLLGITGFFAVINTCRLFSEIFWTSAKTSFARHMKCFTYPFFYLRSESLSAIKIHCCLCTVLKNLPRLLLLSICLLNHNQKSIIAFFCGTLITLNTIAFSFTIAITFPIRKTPRVFTSSACIPFNAFNKFMAAMSSCGVLLAIFATLFKSLRYYALLILLIRFLTWAWPCWKTLRSQTLPLTVFSFLIYFFGLTFVFVFIYIHPFEGIGKLHYYMFYFLEFLQEIIMIYMFTEASLDHVTTYLVFRITMIGFLSNFGLVNILHKYKEEKMNYGCLSTTSMTEKIEELLAEQLPTQK